MGSLWVWFFQTDEGCGHTVGCGEVLYKLRATSREEAEPEIRQLIIDRGGARTGKYNEDRILKEVKLFKLVEDMGPLLETMKQEDREARAAAERKDKLAQLEKLKKDLGI